MSWSEKELKQALERAAEGVHIRPDALRRLQSKLERRPIALRLATIAAGLAAVGSVAAVALVKLAPTKVATIAPATPIAKTSSTTQSSSAAEATSTTGSSPTLSPSPMPACDVTDFSLALKLDAESYGKDEPVGMTLVVRNASGRSCRDRTGSRDGVAFVIYEEGGESPIYSGDCTAPSIALRHMWTRGDKRTFEAAWDHIKNDYGALQRGGSVEECRVGGGRAMAGTYEAVGTFTFDNGLDGTERREFKMRTDRVSFRLEE